MTQPAHTDHRWTAWRYEGLGNCSRICLVCNYQQDRQEPDKDVLDCQGHPIEVTP